MTNPVDSSSIGQGKKPDYGIDAPHALLGFLILGLGGIVSGAIIFFFADQFSGIPPGIFYPFISTGVGFLVFAFGFVWSSKVGKLRLREKILASFPWRGDEMVLDVGCGRGLLLIGAAKRLTNSGKAVGVDIWNRGDQTGNSPSATLENARREGVADKVEVRNGDARELPFPDSTFDMVISSLAIHNIKDQNGRDKAISEIVRILKPGGKAAIYDIKGTKRYAEKFGQAGMTNITISKPVFFSC